MQIQKNRLLKSWNISLDNNDLLRRLRYALRCDDSNTSRLIQLGNGNATTAQVARWRAKEGEADYEPCASEAIESFLSGLIIENRGPRDEPAPSPWPDRAKKAPDAQDSGAQASRAQTNTAPSQSDRPDQVDNNVVLKQLRIALSLRSDDVHSILLAGGSAMSASEAGALFRKPDARNYRQCGDQVLRQFIAGLVKRRENESSDND